MALPAPELDDRTFQDIVDETKRMIPRYCPEWTNHNLSDPGVALIELFAWMSEMVIYRLNQVPDRLYTKFLDMVGIRPFPPSVARTDLTFWLSTVLDHSVVVPAGTEVATAGGLPGEEITFSTTRELEIAPPRLVAAKTAVAGDDQRFADVWDDMRLTGAEVRCFNSEPIAPGDAVYLGFAASLAGAMIRLNVTASIEGIGVDPSDPPIAWEVWTGESWVAAQVFEDSTGGLNRNGSISLALPARMDPIAMGGTRAHWLRGRLTAARSGQPTYQVTPKLSGMTIDTLGGSVAAEHANPLGAESLGRSDGSADQAFNLQRAPALSRRAGEHIRVVAADAADDWAEVADFSASGPWDRHYTLDGATGEVRFGPSVRYPDGTSRQHGAIPPDGAEIVMTGYRSGGGEAGNVGAGTLTRLRRTIAFIDRVSNLSPATGGVDAETVANAKLRGPMTLRTGSRAVTVRDFERLTLEASAEVARVRCLSPATPVEPVRLLVIPQVRSRPEEHVLDDFVMSDELVERITEHLEPRRMLGVTVDIGTPFYQGVSVAALVRALPGRPATLVRQRLMDLLFRYLNPLTGGPEGDGWPFDTDLSAAMLLELLAAVEGVERVEEILLFPYDLRSDARVGAGRDTIRLDGQTLFLSARHQVVVR